jgi:hypothetical protein
MKRVLIIGNSHLLAVLKAGYLASATLDAPQWDAVEFWRSRDMHTYDIELPGTEPMQVRFLLVGAFAPPIVRVDEHGYRWIGESYIRAFDDAAAHFEGSTDQIVSCLFGNEHSVFSLIEHAVPFDVLVDGDDPGVASDGPPRQIVPLDAVVSSLVSRAQPTVEYLGILRNRFPDQEVVHVMPPPPVADADQIRARPELFRKLIEDFGVAPAALRRNVYRLYTDVLREALLPLDIQLLTAPEKAVVDGFLRADLLDGATHANADYGRLVLEQLGAA